ncbi:hypothetical protein [Palleronia caenipelagi]|uniref:DUF2190 family protein n=1 Tax=Palleronia caenipelagi TaxID=2489174 RepID=A0A547PW20_9RHOB|nr:hypothetical protein [Palleronia caenipelagi]TRD18340.1 hypothetical protein FEV53_11840 [Palleronia caenipelagi]
MPKTDTRMPLELTGAEQFLDPVAAGAVILTGALVALDAAGNAVPADPAQPKMRGVALGGADNTGGAAGDLEVPIRRGTWLLKNDGSLTRTAIGSPAFIVDDETVGAAGTLVAGTCLDVRPEGVTVALA